MTPPHKKADENKKWYYRPISILPVISKVYEKVLFDQMNTAISPHFSSNLSGFLKGDSWCMALIKITVDWRAGLHDRKGIVAIAIDLSKAFDSTSHSLLIAKLKPYGFDTDTINLMKSYFHGRRQRIRLDNVFPKWKPITAGVPQGSLLGPLLFNIFINDLNDLISTMSLRLYANDTTEYYKDHSSMVLNYTINKELNAIKEWVTVNHLSINTVKTQALVTYKYELWLAILLWK